MDRRVFNGYVPNTIYYEGTEEQWNTIDIDETTIQEINDSGVKISYCYTNAVSDITQRISERIQSNEDNIQINGTRVGDLERFIGDEYILNGYSLKQIIGDIHSALDELHNYAQALKLPVEVENAVDNLLNTQNELIGGDA